MTQITEAINWRDLVVFDTEGSIGETLGSMVRGCPANLDNAVLNEDGSIAEWAQFLVAAEGEEPDYDTPRCDVDWSGFAEALGR